MKMLKTNKRKSMNVVGLHVAMPSFNKKNNVN